MKIDSHKAIMLEGGVALIGNILLFAIKFWAGIVSRSSALIADAWHTLSDSISSVVIMIGAKISGKKADKEHPFGHGRAEVIASVFVGVLLIIVAFDFLLESIQRFKTHEPAQFGTLAIVITIISILAKEAMARFSLHLYKKNTALSLKADAWHHRSDALSSLIILIGILLSSYAWWMDSVLTLIVALLIGKTAIDIIRDGIRPLMGESPSQELIDYLQDVSTRLIGADPHLHHVHVHRYGEHLEIIFHIQLPAHLTLEKAHAIASNIEQLCMEEKELDATIHVEPIS